MLVSSNWAVGFSKSLLPAAFQTITAPLKQLAVSSGYF